MRYRFDRYELDSEQQTLLLEGQAVHIRPLSFRVLQFLLAHAGELVSQDQLLQAVWKRQAVSSSAVAQTIRDIRALLQDSAQSPRFIQTEHKRGYRFIASVQSEPAQEVSGLLHAPNPGKPYWRALFITAVLLVLAGFILQLALNDVNNFNHRISRQIRNHAYKEADLLLRSALPEANLDQAISLLHHYAEQHLSESGLGLIQQIRKERPEWLNNLEINRLYAHLAGQEGDYGLQKKVAESTFMQKQGLDPKLTLELVQALTSQGDLSTATTMLQTLRKQVESNLKLREYMAEVEWASARMAMQQANYGKATTYLERALKQVNNPLLKINIQLDSILSLTEQRRNDQALQLANSLFQQPLVQAHPYLLARLYRERALAFQGLQKLEDALSDSLAAEEQFARVEARRDLAGMRNNTARLLARMGRKAQAETAFRDALKQFQSLGDTKGEALAWSNLAILASQQGHYQQAYDLGERAIEQFTRIHALGDVARVAFNLGHNALRAGDVSRARDYFEHAQQWYSTSGQPVLQAHTLIALSRANRLLGHLKQALEQADLALAIAQATNNQRRIMLSQFARAESLRLLHQYDKALTAYRQARQLAQSLHLQDWEAVIELGMAETALNQGRFDSAQAQAQLVWIRLNQEKSLEDAIHAGLVLLEARIRSGKTRESDRLFNEIQHLLEQQPISRFQLWLNYLEHLYKKNWNMDIQSWFDERLRVHAFWELQQKMAEGQS